MLAKARRRVVTRVQGFSLLEVLIDPLKLEAFGIPIQEVVRAVRESNQEVGGQVFELAERVPLSATAIARRIQHAEEDLADADTDEKKQNAQQSLDRLKEVQASL